MSYLTSENKTELYKKFGGTTTNTGSVEAQIAVLTKRIDHMSGHLKENKKDHSNRRRLLQLVGRRKSLLAYLTKNDLQSYRSLIGELGLRK